MEQSSTDLTGTIAALKRHQKLIITSAVVTMLAALVYSYQSGESYSAKSLVVIRPVLVEGSITPEELFETDRDPFALSATIDTQAALVLGEDVAARVAETLPAAVIDRATANARPLTDEILEIEALSGDPLSAVQVANAYAAEFLATRRALVREAFLSAVEQLEGRIEALIVRADDLEAQRVLVPDGSAEAIDLVAELRSVSEQIANLTAERDERELDAQTVTGGGDVIQRARAASASGPAPLRDAAVGAFLGLGLGAGLALLRSSSDRRIQTLDAAVHATGTDVLTAIPAVPPWARRSSDSIRVQVLEHDRSGQPIDQRPRGETVKPSPELNGSDPTSGMLWLHPAVASSLSTLRGLVMRKMGHDGKRLVLVSPEPDEGSALVASGLAWSLATAGLKTTAVDAALGDGERHPLFGVRGSAGLGDVLAGQRTLKESILSTSVPGLEFLPAGPVSTSHDDALAARRGPVAEVFGRPSDMIVVRAPSMASGGDAIAWAEDADATLLVLRAGISRPGVAGRASLRLHSLWTPLLGVVLTDVRQTDGTLGVREKDSLRSAVLRASGDAHISMLPDVRHLDGTEQAHEVDVAEPPPSRVVTPRQRSTQRRAT